MKTFRFGLIGLVLALMAFVAQNPDPASAIFPVGSVVAGIGVNSARTGATVDRAGFAGAMLLVAQGHVTNGAGAIVYWVLQDSGTAWTARDSVLADTIDNKGFKLTYRGANRYLRLIQRATSASSDTTISAGMILLTGKRSR